MTVKRLVLNFGGRSVDFRIGPDALSEFSRISRGVVGRPVRAFVVEDPALPQEVSTRIAHELIDAGFKIERWQAPAAASITFEVISEVLALLGSAQITADDVIVAAGGVRVTSLGAYVARLWCGSTPCVLVPTDLEGMVCAATASDPIDVAGTEGHVLLRPEPSMVFCDVSLLSGDSEPAGNVLLLGAALADSKRSWDRLKDHAAKIGEGDPVAIVDAVCNAQTCRRSVVASANPSARHALSFGVTTARALRACLAHRNVPAPWWQLLAEGMRFEARLATEAGKFSVEEVFALDDALEDLGVEELAFDIDVEEFLKALEEENARWSNRLFFALPKGFGSIRLVNVDDEVLRRHAEAYLASRAELLEDAVQ